MGHHRHQLLHCPQVRMAGSFQSLNGWFSPSCRGKWFVLIKWHCLDESEATWEPVEDFHAAYPSFQLEDELFPDWARDVMSGNVYMRRSHGEMGRTVKNWATA